MLSCNGSILLLHELGIMRETGLFSAMKDEVMLSLFLLDTNMFIMLPTSCCTPLMGSTSYMNIYTVYINIPVYIFELREI